MPQPKPARNRAEASAPAPSAPNFVVTTMTALAALVVVMALFGTDKHSERAFRLLNKD